MNIKRLPRSPIPKVPTFGELKPGDVFAVSGNVYLKINPTASCPTGNAVTLSYNSGSVCAFVNHNSVEPLPDAELVIP